MSEYDHESIDSSWNEQKEKEKDVKSQSGENYHQPTFTIFLSSLSMQVMIALGRLENPATRALDKNMDQARFLIDTLAIIQDKTDGNLDESEKKLLEESLYNLKIMYLEEKKKED